MVVTGTDVGVASHGSLLLANNERQLHMSLQLLHAVRDVDSFLLQEATPGDVRRFVEACRDLHQDGHLFAPPGGLGQGFDDRRVAARTVDRQLDGQDRRVRRGRFQKTQDRRVEALVRMVQQQIGASDLLEDGPRIVVRQSDQTRMRHRLVSRKPQVVAPRRFEFLQISQPEQRLRAVDVVTGHAQLLGQPLRQLLGHCRIDLESHDPGEAPCLQLFAHLADDASRIHQRPILGQVRRAGGLSLGSPGDAEEVDFLGRRVRIEQVEIRRNHLLQQDPARPVGKRDPARPVVGHLDSDEALGSGSAVGNRDREIQPQVADERKGMFGVDGQRSEDRLDVALEVLAQQALLFRFESGVGQHG